MNENSKEGVSKKNNIVCISNSSASTSLGSSTKATSTVQYNIMQQPILEEATSGNWLCIARNIRANPLSMCVGVTINFAYISPSSIMYKSFLNQYYTARNFAGRFCQAQLPFYCKNIAQVFS